MASDWAAVLSAVSCCFSDDYRTTLKWAVTLRHGTLFLIIACDLAKQYLRVSPIQTGNITAINQVSKQWRVFSTPRPVSNLLCAGIISYACNYLLHTTNLRPVWYICMPNSQFFVSIHEINSRWWGSVWVSITTDIYCKSTLSSNYLLCLSAARRSHFCTYLGRNISWFLLNNLQHSKKFKLRI